MQEYLELKNMNKQEAIILFKFRIRMTPFGENFKAGKVDSFCPLCQSHRDSQEESFNCLALRKMVDMKGKYSNIFDNKFTEDLIRSLKNIYTYQIEYNK